jgi:hypothetical protein
MFSCVIRNVLTLYWQRATLLSSATIHSIIPTFTDVVQPTSGATFKPHYGTLALITPPYLQPVAACERIVMTAAAAATHSWLL